MSAHNRSHGPADRIPSDGLPNSKSGGHQIPPQNPAGSPKPTVPSMPRPDVRSPGQGAGNTPRGDSKGTSSADIPSGGQAGLAKSEDAMRKGGTFERFSDGRGGNS